MPRLGTYLFIFVCVGLGLITGAGAFLATHRWVDLSALDRASHGRPTILLDDEGNEWARFQLDRREPIPLAAVPPHLIQAFLATEDHTFFDHYGISLRGIIRSIAVNIIRGRTVQGASTITQQLVRQLFLNYERTFTRKAKEQFLSLVVEYQFTKEQILESYLNHIYFGIDIYGIEAAAQRFWGISATDLQPHQSATLAAIVRSPNHYCPILNEKAALDRRNLVLKLMYQRGYVSADQLAHQQACPLGIMRERQPAIAPHLREEIRRTLEEKFGRRALYCAGFTVQTTLNRRAQLHAQKTFGSHLATLSKIDAELDGALICLDTQNTGIKALVGGRDFATSQYNRALQARRQMGSTFKPVVYTAALENGHQLSDTLIDEPLQSVANWQPHNVQEKFEGTITLAHALMVSNNIIPVKLLLEIGAEKIISCARALHLNGSLPPYPSLALGSTDCTPLQSAALFNTFVNRGIYQEPYLIEWIKDGQGRKIWKHTPSQERAISWEVSSQILQGLRLVAAHMHDRLGKWIIGDTAGKTGTTNEHRTCWFAGSTPTHTTVVYLGRDDNKTLKNRVFSTWHACPLWIDFNREIEEPQSTFYFSPQVRRLLINERTGQPATIGEAETIAILAP